MSWVISSTAVPRSRHRVFKSAMICACTDTSSAVVGSVGHQQLRLGGQRQRDHHPLPHAARELVWVVVQPLGCGGNAGVGQQRRRAPLGFSRRDRQVRQDGFGELPAHGVERVERGEWVLKNRTDLPTPDAPASQTRAGR